MKAAYDVDARKRPVNLTLNENLVNRVREVADNLSGVVESLLADFVRRAETERIAKSKAVDAAIAVWNRFSEEHGSFSEEHSTL